jgi:hypothetical protein
MMLRLPSISISGLALAATDCRAQPFGLAELSEQTRQCVACHKTENPALYEQWGSSLHFRANIGCFECHSTTSGDVDSYEHYGQQIATLVTPKDCSRCHSKEVEQFTASRHARAAAIRGSPDEMLATVVEGNQGMHTPAFPAGSSAAAVTSCVHCHGSQARLLPGGKLDPATWPSGGIGRLNPDGSLGSCTSCHSRHSFSAAQARHPATCGNCHTGPDHPQREIYESSMHGAAFLARIADMNLESPKWIIGEDYAAAPTCATCHMSATRTQPPTHDVGMRISWNHRPASSLRADAADARMQLPGAQVPWQVRRDNMKNVCLNCHHTQWVDGFFQQYDSLIELYDTKFAVPGEKLYSLAAPLLKPEPFSNDADWAWYELWHRAGRRARQGAAMMSADAVQTGMYDVARLFYTELVPRLTSLAAENLASTDPARAAAASALKSALDDTLTSETTAGSSESRTLTPRPSERAPRSSSAAGTRRSKPGQGRPDRLPSQGRNTIEATTDRQPACNANWDAIR